MLGTRGVVKEKEMKVNFVMATLLPCAVPFSLFAQTPAAAVQPSALEEFDKARIDTLLASSTPNGEPTAVPTAPAAPAAPGGRFAQPRGKPAPPGGGAPKAPASSGAPDSNAKPGAKPEAKPEAKAAAKEPRSTWLFPDWGAAGFDWNLSPMVGFESQKDSDSGASQDTLEFGLQAGLTGVPVVPGNPGLQLAPTVGAAYGLVTLTPPEGKTATGDYVRLWGGNSFIVPLRFYRNVFSLRYGHVKGKLTPLTQSFALSDDNGVLVLPFVSTHYTYTYSRLFSHSWAQLQLQSNDNWLHVRFFTAVLNAHIDLGPGLTYYHFYDSTQSSPPEIATARVTDFRLFTGSDIFWKLAASGSFRYVMSANVSDLAQKAGHVRLPTEPVGAPSTLVVEPYDSLIGSAFFGLKHLIGGLSVGWQYNFNAQHFLEKDGQKRRVEKRQGVGVSYEATL